MSRNELYPQTPVFPYRTERQIPLGVESLRKLYLSVMSRPSEISGVYGGKQEHQVSGPLLADPRNQECQPERRIPVLALRRSK